MRFLQQRYGQPTGIGQVIADSDLASDFIDNPLDTSLREVQNEAWGRGDIPTLLGATALRALNSQSPVVGEQSYSGYRDNMVPGPLGLYYTPNEPVDPRDCENWPNSPYCDGIGASGQSANFGTGLGVGVSVNNCEQCIEIRHSLAYIALPSYSVCNRAPDGFFVRDGVLGPIACTPPNVPPPPEPEDPNIPAHPQVRDAYNPPGLCRIVVARSRYVDSLAGREPAVIANLAPGLSFGGPPLNQLWASDTVPRYQWRNVGDPQIVYVERWRVTVRTRSGFEYYDASSREEADRLVAENEQRGDVFDAFRAFFGGILVQNEATYRDFFQLFTIPGTNTPIFGASPSLVANSILQNPVAWGLPESANSNNVTIENIGDVPLFLVRYGLINFPCGQIPPPPQPNGVDMGCSCEENEELLRAIYNRLGVEQFPVELPSRLFTNDEGESTIETFAEYVTYFLEQVDGLIGQFPIDIEIEDTDPIEEGQQRKQVQLKNIAETLADLYALGVRSGTDGAVATQALVKIAAEVMATRLTGLTTLDYTKANADFLGYKGNPVNRRVELNFNPDEDDLLRLEDFFKQTVKRYKGWRNEGAESVFDYLQKNQFINGILKEVFFRGADRLLEFERELDEPIRDFQDLENRWRQFINETEDPQGFRNTGQSAPRVTDVSNPTDSNRINRPT